MTVWVVGGRQARAAGVADRDHRGLYDQGLLLQVEPASGTVRRVLVDADRTGLGAAFKGIARVGCRLLVSQEGAVLEVVDGAVTQRWSDPRWNDVHHAIEHDGTRIVVSTGTDGVLVGDRYVPVVEGAVAPTRDVRRCSLAPHRAHPNHGFVVDGRVLVTRGALGDAVSLDGAMRWPLADVVVHDGVVRSDGVWFTAVDGRLLRVDPSTGQVDRELRLRRAGDPPLGWCRGLVLDGGLAWVGFSRLRATRWRRNLAWARGVARGRVDVTRERTRLVGVDLATGAQVAQIDLAEHGVDAVFGMCASPPVQA